MGSINVPAAEKAFICIYIWWQWFCEVPQGFMGSIFWVSLRSICLFQVWDKIRLQEGVDRPTHLKWFWTLFEEVSLHKTEIHVSIKPPWIGWLIVPLHLRYPFSPQISLFTLDIPFQLSNYFYPGWSSMQSFCAPCLQHHFLWVYKPDVWKAEDIPEGTVYTESDYTLQIMISAAALPVLLFILVWVPGSFASKYQLTF